MPIIYDLETDIRFLQGVEKQTRKQEETDKAKIIKMLKIPHLSVEEIAHCMDVSIDYVNELKNQLKD